MQENLLQSSIIIAEKMLAHHEQMRNAYFFTPPKSAVSRRNYEMQHTKELSFDYEGHTYKYSSNCTCSCRYVYFSDNFVYDGKRTTARRVKNLLAKMQNAKQEQDDCNAEIELLT